ncbi:MAG: hypothetical protein IT378_04170 [Sandaracinaceae bacterium]|nr:hypothetical protein [Sandaracinaceae bacterium]
MFEPDLDKLLEKARKLGWSETSNLSEASVVLYGSLNQRNEAIAYSHAIRRVGQGWEEVYGNDHNRWEDSSPPAKHSGDFIVALLKAP